jgi:hypothetical protein
MGSCCTTLSGISSLPHEFRHELPPENTRFCYRLRFVFQRHAVEFHLVWVGADARGLYVSVAGASALVPWKQTAVAGAHHAGCARWANIQWAHLRVLLPVSVFESTVRPACPPSSIEEGFSLPTLLRTADASGSVHCPLGRVPVAPSFAVLPSVREGSDRLSAGSEGEACDEHIQLLNA